MSRWTPTTCIQRNPAAVWRGFTAEIAVLDPMLQRLSTFNEVASRCWELADGRSFSALIDQLLNEFEVGRIQLEQDVRLFLDELAERGLLQE